MTKKSALFSPHGRVPGVGTCSLSPSGTQPSSPPPSSAPWLPRPTQLRFTRAILFALLSTLFQGPASPLLNTCDSGGTCQSQKYPAPLSQPANSRAPLQS